MRNFLNILYHSSFVSSIIMSIKSLYNYRSIILILLAPIIVMYGIIYVGLFIFSFVMWKLPATIPIPFVGNSVTDRGLLIVGVCLVLLHFIDKINER